MTTPQELQNALTSNPAITNAAQQAISSGCGIGASLSEVRSAINTATTAINNAVQTATDIVSFVQNLPALMTAQVTAVVSSAISNVLGPVRSLANQVEQEIASLVRLTNDHVGFLSQYLRIQLLFPNLDLNGLLNNLLSGVSICQASATAAEQPANHPPSNQPAQAAPEPEPIPAAPEIEPSPNTSIAAQSEITREQLPAPEGVADATPTQVEMTLANLRRQQVEQLTVERYRLSLQRNYESSPEVRASLTRQMEEIQNRISDALSGR